jgi:urease accessory protein
MLDRPQQDAGDAGSDMAVTVLPAFVRAHGGVRVAFARVGAGSTARTVRTRSAESGGYRARFPNRPDDACEAVLINTGGGMTGGDTFAVEITAGEGADAIVTTQAAEKIYRSQGPDTVIDTALTLAPGARLDWLPQEAILFARAALKRSLAVEMAADATLHACEALYFGRAAMGEILETASLRDRWRIRRGGRLIFADDVRLDGLVNLTLARPAIAGGARATATALSIAPDAAARLDAAREAMGDCVSEFGVSALDGMLIARLLSPDAAALRADLARLMTFLTGRALPRSWQT